MSFKCGIVGLPNVGKSTLFNALTNSNKAQAANFPFCTIDPNVGVVPVPDKRLEKLSKIFKKFAEENIEDLSEEVLKKYEAAPFRAPMIIVLVTEIKEHPKVPEIEQMFSTAAAAENILLALNSLGYAGVWRTGKFALEDKISEYLGLSSNQKVIGYLYVGTPSGKQKKIPEMNPKDFVTKWE